MTQTPSPLVMLRADIRASIDTDATATRSSRVATTIGKVLLTTRLQAVILFRLAQALRRPFAPLASVARYLNMVLTGADIATAATIGPGLQLFHPGGVVIGPECVVGSRCTIMQGVTLGAGAGGSPALGDDVFVGAGAKIFGRIRIEDRCVIGANAVVLEAMPPDSFVAGVPAKVVKRIDRPHHLRDAS
jgi:serine O-acetyltransferase